MITAYTLRELDGTCINVLNKDERLEDTWTSYNCLVSDSLPCTSAFYEHVLYVLPPVYSVFDCWGL